MKPILTDRFIVWPTEGKEMDDVQYEFSRLRDGVDACCGDIDGACAATSLSLQQRASSRVSPPCVTLRDPRV